MSDQGSREDRWYFEVTINDEKTGARRSADVYLPDGGDAAAELLGVLVSAATSANLGGEVLRHLGEVRGFGCGRDHGAADELARIVKALDDAGFGDVATPAHLRVVGLLAQRVANPPRSPVEPQGDDPANEAVEWIDGRPVRDVGLPVDEGGEGR